LSLIYHLAREPKYGALPHHGALVNDEQVQKIARHLRPPFFEPPDLVMILAPGNLCDRKFE
jgi:hypothetical protein